jgi:multimeric flavodoxin WrbA
VTESNLTALALVCSLKPSPAPSSSELIARHLQDQLEQYGVTGEFVRCVDHDIKPGVEKDMGDGDRWPAIREKILAADILILSTPTWMGHTSSVAQRVLERLDAEVSETDDEGRPILLGKVAIVAVVGNEDGAHHIVAEAFQALNDVGYTIPAQGCTYWNGPAMGKTDYNDLDEVPEGTASATAAAARNAAHLARALKGSQYLPYPS